MGRSVFEACPVVDGRDPRAARRAPHTVDAAVRVGGTCGPTGGKRRAVVGSAGGRLPLSAALIEPVTLAVHLEDLDVVCEAVEKRACEPF